MLQVDLYFSALTSCLQHRIRGRNPNFLAYCSIEVVISPSSLSGYLGVFFVVGCYATLQWTAYITQNGMINDELERIWKEAAVV
jgi:hypothetical protein